MKKKILFVFLIVIGLSLVSFAQEEAVSESGVQKVKDATPIFVWSVIIGGAAISLAAIGGAVSQSKALRTAAENIGRNPEAADAIRGITIIGLALIESLVIYVLLVDIFIFLFKWGKYSY
jgi:F-type H+-transporting ATPase subunit c